jgi:hypothetical protein
MARSIGTIAGSIAGAIVAGVVVAFAVTGALDQVVWPSFFVGIPAGVLTAVLVFLGAFFVLRRHGGHDQPT